MTSCGECGAACVWDEDVCSAICTQCGTLSDPSQSLLSTHVEYSDTSAAQYPSSSYSSSTTLKSIRSKNGWNLAGQGKEARDRKNAFAIHSFIKSLLTRLNYPGLSPRAIIIFTQAMSKGNYKWGRRAKLAAGASIAIALREAHKSDSLRDIAFLLDDSPISLSRAFTAVVSLLEFKLDSTDPSVHFLIIQAHLQSLLHSQSQSTSISLLPEHGSLLKSLSFPSIIRIATSLSDILIGHVPVLPIAQLPTPPTACAILILALEAELRTSFPKLGEFSSVLASRFGFARGVVMSRYRTIYDLVEEWIREVPWLDHFEPKNKGHGKKARAKVPKRSIVAGGLKDVIQFREEIWEKKFENQDKLNIALDVDSEVDEDEDGEIINLDDPKVSTTMMAKNRVMPDHVDTLTHPHKKRKTTHGTLGQACQFLLDPLSSALPPASSSATSQVSSHLVSPSSAQSPSLASYLLACSPDLPLRNKPTRLQLLATARGGSDLNHVGDDELFEESEWEGIFRSEEEREKLQPLFMLEWGEDDLVDKPDSYSEENAQTKKSSKGKGKEVARGANRINMDALERVLRGTDSLVEEGQSDDEYAGVDVGEYPSSPVLNTTGFTTTDGAEEIEAWRPLSPDGGGQGGVDRYDEEY
ncbi:hypothetical protein SERLA73DRAFT_186453 [Serpula lacrymans var. lacrymans S7.3]|uniref:Uncharacterized protein n=2 Tax=Serpula lacrymans var. lacrymans TaxID=341189 RepID=F8Q7A9_SERL3|nr:uncharacterized protein SERLADRAFT_441364 [Serpula lacrymans var. lacrymans S7.9]EGN95447.1 hypothetical protein SERLA73DRAFT_186453 [Serpula lacrymans var. lacrymans S7.3]EGO20977.1 hypothetical protein SERLADRAFT_441364 [Serpula lacrymans var. lacrymans S7.9]